MKKNFAAPDEIRSFDKSKIQVVNLGRVEVLRVTNPPGWRWSQSVKPSAGTDSCQVAHLIHVISGRIAVRMDDGSEAEFGPGDVGLVPPGHDAWIVGDEPFVSSLTALPTQATGEQWVLARMRHRRRNHFPVQLNKRYKSPELPIKALKLEEPYRWTHRQLRRTKSKCLTPRLQNPTKPGFQASGTLKRDNGFSRQRMLKI
jgi:EutQ-like cupin domain